MSILFPLAVCLASFGLGWIQGYSFGVIFTIDKLKKARTKTTDLFPPKD